MKLDIKKIRRLSEDDKPIYIFFANRLREQCEIFTATFPGVVSYAVKANPSREILKHILDCGIAAFDVASLGEIEAIRSLDKDVRLLFMNPVKSESHIKQAYTRYNVRAFAVDTLSEYEKIVKCIGEKSALDIFVRVIVDNSKSSVSLSGKFGCSSEDAETLLNHFKEQGHRVGLCFHVGSQCNDPLAFVRSIETCSAIADKLSFELDFLDVGGGFPTDLSNQETPLLQNYFSAIKDTLQRSSFNESTEILCEPGRALVAGCEALIVKVLGKKSSCLTINDGIFGGLFEENEGISHPISHLNIRKKEASNVVPFKIYGPTCDSFDALKIEVELARDTSEGDLLVIEQVGAYSRSLRTDFNGFGDYNLLIDSDTIYQEAQIKRTPTLI